MAVFQQFPRLYDQSGQGTTTNYYGGLSRPNTLSSYSGNQNIGAVKTGTATSPSPNTSPTPSPTQTGRQVTVDPATGQLLIDGRPIGEGNSQFGSAGQLYDGSGRLESYDPRYYEQYQRDIGDSNTETAWRIRPDVLARLGDRVQLTGPGVVGRNPDGSVMEGQGYQEVLDPTQVSWDDEFGLITNRNNISGPDPQKKQQDRLRNAALMTALTAGTVGAVGQAGGFAAGAFGSTPTTIPMGGYAAPGFEAAGSAAAASGGAGVIPGLDVASGTVGAPGYLAEGGGALAGGGASIPTAMTEGYLAGGAAAPTASTLASTINTLGGTLPAGMTLIDIAGVGLPLYNAIRRRGGEEQYRGDINAAANRADPWGAGTDPNGVPNRTASQQRLWELYNDPSKIVDTPGYRFAQQQGEQGVERQAAQRGYFRSPNMLYDLSKFNQGLATQTYDKEMQRLFAMSGVQFDPGNAGRIQAGGADNGSSMRQASTNAWMDFGRTFVDWLGRVG